MMALNKINILYKYAAKIFEQLKNMVFQYRDLVVALNGINDSEIKALYKCINIMKIKLKLQKQFALDPTEHIFQVENTL